MPVNSGLSGLSDTLFVVAVFLYSLAMVAHAAEFAAGRTRRERTAARATTVPAADRELVGAGGPAITVPSVPAYLTRGKGAGVSVPTSPVGGAGDSAGSRRIGLVAVLLTALGFGVHAGSVLLRGLATHRVPFGNMYEFSSAVALSAVGAYLVLLTRHRVRYLGIFVLLPAVLTMGLAGTVLYAAAGPLVPALNSYWLQIHVTGAIISTGVFLVGSIAGALYLVADSYASRMRAGKPAGFTSIARRLPEPAVLDRLSYRTIAFGFPVWTFAIIAGAIWAEAAWGRYWGWDPKETWAFITWIIYAGYLHARATAGWKGRRASWIAVIGLVAFVFNYFGVNLWVNGLHSYSGV